MRLRLNLRLLGGVLLCGALPVGTPAPAPALADTGQVLVPEDCTTLSAGDLGRPLHGTFTDSSQLGCFELPLAAKTPTAVTQPLAGSSSVPVSMTLIDADGTVVCTNTRLAGGACGLVGTAPFRLVTTPDTVGAAGDYQVEVQPVSGDTGCATQVPLGTVGSGTGVDAALSADAFATCYSILADGYSTTEVLTMARTSGSGNAKVAVFNQAGDRACGAQTLDSTAAAVIWCTLMPSTAAYTVVLWGQAVPATFQLARRDISAESLTCQPLSVTDIGGPATTGTVDTASDVRCYDVAAHAGDADLIDVRSPGARVTMTWVLPNGGYYCRASIYPCITDSGSTDRHYRVLVWAATADPIPYQLDAWTVVTGGGISPLCERLPSVAYGSDPLDITLSDQQTARCVVAPVGIEDRYQIPITGVDSTAKQPATYVFGALGPNVLTYARPCPATGCYANALVPRGQSTDGLFFFTPGEQFGEVSYQARIGCLTEPCGGQPYSISTVNPSDLRTGDKVTLTATGAGFDATDTVRLLQAGSAPISATIRSVTADRHTFVVDADLAAAAAGYWKLTVTSAKTGQMAEYGSIIVAGPTLKATTLPSISGTVGVGVTVTAMPGRWTPGAAAYAYQWSANGTAIRGATKPTYAIPASLLGRKLTVTVTATRAFHPDGQATSATKTVALGAALRAAKLPRITGTVRVKRTVHVSAGTWSPAATSYSYHWYLNGKAIKGATRSSLRITSSMRGNKLTVVVTAHKAGYHDGHATSASVKAR